MEMKKNECLDDMEKRAMELLRNMETDQIAACLRSDDRNELSVTLKRQILPILNSNLKCSKWNDQKLNEAIGKEIGSALSPPRVDKEE